jgi:rhodanese-related sulfurtransferase
MLNLPFAVHAGDHDQMITAPELKARIDKGENILIIDVRTGSDYEGSKYKIKGAVRIPIVSVEAKITELPKDRPIIFYCS